MRISDWSSDVCSSDIREPAAKHLGDLVGLPVDQLTDLVVHDRHLVVGRHELVAVGPFELEAELVVEVDLVVFVAVDLHAGAESERVRSEEHTSELQSLMRISYAVFCLKKKQN